MRKSLLILIGILFLLATILTIGLLNDFLEVDRCLDSGGKWDYEVGTCVREE